MASTLPTLPNLVQQQIAPAGSVTGYAPAQAKATTATATGYTATTGAAGNRAVGKNELVENRIQGIIASGSPLLQQAQTRALQQMNGRGLLNTSMTVGASEGALYDAAMPIASQDATTYRGAADLDYSTKADMSKFNAGQVNNASQFGAAAQNDASKINAQLGTDVSLNNARFGNEASQFTADAANKAGSLNAEIGAQKDRLAMEITSRETISKLDNDTREKMASIEAGYKVQMQSQDSSARLFDQISVQMSQIAMNKDLTPEAKKKATQSLQDQLINGLNILGSVAGLNLSSILQFPGTTSTSSLDDQRRAQQLREMTSVDVTGRNGGIIAGPATSISGTQPAAPIAGGAAPATEPTQSATGVASNPVQMHQENLYRIAQLPAVEGDYVQSEYATMLRDGTAPEVAIQAAISKATDTEAQFDRVIEANAEKYNLPRNYGLTYRDEARRKYDELIEQSTLPTEAAAQTIAHMKEWIAAFETPIMPGRSPQRT